ncbi:MAG: hypothetical protein AVDCRST_MAG49-3384 [uncultured Thermomicrobiales bacterium]|uniref:HTH luxR-type domain-containing protein n=1 Tax=uncultured Thermomicrobiales bacterium TaxID=1645740 RepID=A0A6J4V5S0_9BACT|nr:MAG: hypothetical protein AVDCRST_MAG49-3384 [uncultured Thermomicrobiales bacterium]
MPDAPPSAATGVPPCPPTPLVGRAREVAAVAALLREGGARLVTLTGPGGVGKTRLALRAAEELRGDFADGARFVNLSALVNPELVLPEIVRALGLVGTDDRPVAERLAAWLGSRRLLLVLDNLEQVVEVAPELGALLPACPGLAILATSRVVLRLSAEHVFPVEPLALPDPAGPIPLGDLAGVEAVALFTQRARAADPGFVLTEANAPTVAAIVRRLEGLPLAIELAAARTRQLSLAAVLGQLGGGLRVLAGGPRDAPARQRTLRSAIAWSHDLLPPEEQTLFRRLAVFAGGWTAGAAEAVCGEDEFDTLDGLFGLVDHSLVRRVEPVGRGAPVASDHEPRFRMLETVREFALERLEASGEAEAVRSRHAAHVAEFAQRTAGVLQTVSVASLAKLAAEHDNARAALAWAIEHDEPEIGLRVATPYYRLWQIQGHLGEGRRWLGQVLALGGAAPPALRAAAFFGAGWLAGLQGDLEAAETAHREAVALGRTAGAARAEALGVIGLGVVADRRGNLDGAEARNREALDLARAAGDEECMGWALGNLGVVALDRGDLAEAVRLLEDSLRQDRRFDDLWGVVLELANLSEVARRQGDMRRAAALNRERLAVSRALDYREQLADGCLAAADTAAWLGQPDRVARLLAAATMTLGTIGFGIGPEWQSEIDATAAAARAALGDAAFEAAWAAGRALPLEAAVAEAEATAAAGETAAGEPTAPPAAPLPPSSAAVTHGLSPRELEVVRLLAAGRSNREIADALFVSHGTATTHVRNVLAKLGLGSRTAVAAWAIRSGIA